MAERNPAIRVLLLPKDTNAYGTIFGGVILSNIDLASAIEARKVARAPLRHQGDARGRVPRAGVPRRHRELLHRDACASAARRSRSACRSRPSGGAPVPPSGAAGPRRDGQGDRSGGRARRRERAGAAGAHPAGDAAGVDAAQGSRLDTLDIDCHGRHARPCPMKWISTGARPLRRRSSTRSSPARPRTAACTCPNGSTRCRRRRSRRSPAPTSAEIGADVGAQLLDGDITRDGPGGAGERRAQFPDPARPGHRPRVGARAVPRADVRLQGCRRPRPGAAAAPLHGRNAADDSRRHVRRHRQRGGPGVPRRSRHARRRAVSAGPGQRRPGSADGVARRQHPGGGRATARSTTASGWSRRRSPTTSCARTSG